MNKTQDTAPAGAIPPAPVSADKATEAKPVATPEAKPAVVQKAPETKQKPTA